MIVVDTNVLSYFYLRDQYGTEVDALFRKNPEWIAPLLWRSEFRNTLLGYVRRDRMTVDRAVALMDDAEDLLQGSEHIPDSRDVLELARDSGCTAYDCEFVALARSFGVKLVTMDRQILKAFPKFAVSLMEA